jgi:hypothetical protein
MFVKSTHLPAEYLLAYPTKSEYTFKVPFCIQRKYLQRILRKCVLHAKYPDVYPAEVHLPAKNPAEVYATCKAICRSVLPSKHSAEVYVTCKAFCGNVFYLQSTLLYIQRKVTAMKSPILAKNIRSRGIPEQVHRFSMAVI